MVRGLCFQKKDNIIEHGHCIENVIHIYVQIPKYGKKKKSLKAKVVSFCNLCDVFLLEIIDFKDNTIPYVRDR